MVAVERVPEPVVSSQGGLNNSAGCLSVDWATRPGRAAELGLSTHVVAGLYMEGDDVGDADADADVGGADVDDDAGFVGVVAVEPHEELAAEAYVRL